jgi:hypothetical protein
LPTPLGDVWDAHRRWSTDGTLTKVFVVWIHRDRDILELQCGLEEHKGPSCTFHITEIEHPINDEGVMDVDEDDTSDEDSEVDASAEDDASADAQSIDVDSLESLDSDVFMGRSGVYGWCNTDWTDTLDSPVTNDGTGNDRAASSVSSWYDLDRDRPEGFETVTETALQTRVEQWLRQECAAFFPFVPPAP